MSRSRPCCGNVATPALTVRPPPGLTSAAPRRVTIDWAVASAIGSLTSGSSSANSSPPSRNASPPERRRAATLERTPSPAGCPKRSLTCLKSSRSRRQSESCVPSLACGRDRRFEPLVEMTMVAEARERVGEREPDRAEHAVCRTLVQRDRRERTRQRREQIGRPLPEHDQHQRRRRHQRERQDRPVHVRADQADVAELRPRRGHRGRDEQHVRRVEHRGGERDLEQQVSRAGAVDELEHRARDRPDDSEDAGVVDGADRGLVLEERGHVGAVT